MDSRPQTTTVVWSGRCTTICRLCLRQDGFLIAIFNNNPSQTGEHKSIQKKISECTTLELSSGDGLPPCVCHRCLYKVDLCLDFKRQCLVSDATLRQANGHCNGDGSSEHDSEDYQRVISHSEQMYLAEHVQNVEEVVMVVDPNMDYDSENESDLEQHISDTENVSEQLKNVFMCQYCDKAYTSRDECHNHELSGHDNEIPFKCSSCDMGFADRTIYTAHQKSVHGNDKPFGCPQCNRSFSRRSDLRKHTVVHTGVKPFTCSICLKSFSRNTNLTKHMRIHSGDKPYVCPQCPKTFISKGDLTRHAMIHTGQRPFACHHCDQSFGRRDKLLRHEKRHLKLQQEQETERLELWSAIKQEMPDCEPEDDGGEDWNGENMVISVDPFGHHDHGLEPKDDQEEVSEVGAGDESSLLPRVPEHITADSGFGDAASEAPQQMVKRYPCLLCHRRFPSADSLRAHVQVHHGDAVKPHACYQCSKSFMRKRELDRHITTHTGKKPFTCASCGKRFGRKDKLVRHMRIHEPGRALPCSICGVGFSRKDVLAQHMKTAHANESTAPAIELPEVISQFAPKDDQEEVSEVGAGDDSSLLPRVPEHITADSGFGDAGGEVPQQMVKRYPCLLCHRRFPSADSLRAHVQLHHGDVVKPHACYQCSKSFMRKRELDRHITTHTGKKPFTCSSCGKRFGRKDKLVRHMRIHEPGRALPCSICGVGFSRKDVLAQHMKTAHANESTAPAIELPEVISQ